MLSNHSDEIPGNSHYKKNSQKHIILLWMVIALITIGFGVFNHYSNKNVSPVHTGPKMEKAATTIIMTGRYAMGAKTFYSIMGKEGSDDLYRNLALQLKNYCRNTTDQTVIVPFIAELAGQDAVKDYMVRLKEDSDLSESLLMDLESFQKIYENGPDTLEQYEYERLIDRHQWIAKVALSFGLPSSDPFRIEVMRPAKRTFTVFIVFMSAVLMSGGAGLILLIITIVMVLSKRLTVGFPADHIPGVFTKSAFLETTALFLVAITVMTVIGGFIPRILFWFLYLILTVFAILWPLLRGMNLKSLMIALGWHKGKGIFREIGSGFAGYLAGLPIIICGAVITLIIVKYSGVQPGHPIVHQFRDAGFWKIAKLLLLACVMAPILEETLFRGAFYRHLRIRHSVFLSALLSGLFFAVIHPQGFAAFPALGSLGAVFALIREWRGSLIGSMVAHALNNFVITMLLVLTIYNT